MSGNSGRPSVFSLQGSPQRVCAGFARRLRASQSSTSELTQARQDRSGALGEIRTPDPRNRNPMLYPAELRAPCGVDYQTWPGWASAWIDAWRGRCATLAGRTPDLNRDGRPRSSKLTNRGVGGGPGRDRSQPPGRSVRSMGRHNRRSYRDRGLAHNCAGN